MPNLSIVLSTLKMFSSWVWISLVPSISSSPSLKSVTEKLWLVQNATVGLERKVYDINSHIVDNSPVMCCFVAGPKPSKIQFSEFSMCHSTANSAK